MSGPAIAVGTIVRGRQAHLHNLLRGLAVQRRPPDGIVVVHMGGEDPVPVVRRSGLDVEVVRVQDDATDLPLSRARNAVRAAAGDVRHLILLDVDVIPEPDLVGDYLELLERAPAVWSGRVDYLRPMTLDGELDVNLLRANGAPHPARRPPERDTTLPRPELFWSLSFALPTAVWDDVGGFDERFRGYGAEDTDFALRVDAAGVPLGWTARARGHHQHHTSHSPPVNHLVDIVSNACRFHERWGSWPMEGWLAEFADLGLVEWRPDEAHLATTDRGRRRWAAARAA